MRGARDERVAQEGLSCARDGLPLRPTTRTRGTNMAVPRERRTITYATLLVLTLLATVLCAVTGVPANAEPISPAGGTGRTAQPQPTPESARQGPHASLEKSCSDVRADLGKLASAGWKVATCIKPGPRQHISRAQLSAGASRAPVPMPQWCYDQATGDGTWWFTRHDACSVKVWILDVLQVPGGQLIGQMTYLQADLVYPQSDVPAWGHQVAIDQTAGWGQIAGTRLSGSGSCTGACTLPAANIDFPSQAVTMTGLAYGQIIPESTSTATGAVGTARTKVTYHFSNPSWTTPSNTVTSQPPLDVRCDNAVPGYARAGCVIPHFAPWMTYALNGPYPELAGHIRDAQASGLPGGQHSTPLERLTDPVKQDENRRRACPRSLPRPPGKTCDEYPFASTWQGAATSAGQFSRRMINAGQNSAGGSALNEFFKAQRIIEKDKFHVVIH